MPPMHSLTDLCDIKLDTLYTSCHVKILYKIYNYIFYRLVIIFINVRC